MPRHSHQSCSTSSSTSTYIHQPRHHSSPLKSTPTPFTTLRLLPSTSPRIPPHSRIPSHQPSGLPPTKPKAPDVLSSSTNATMPPVPTSADRTLAPLLKPTRKSHSKQPKKPDSRPTLDRRSPSPAHLQEQASHSDTNRPSARKSRSAHRAKPRSRARSLSPSRSPAAPSGTPADAAPPKSNHSRRTRTVTLNDHPTLITYEVPEICLPLKTTLDFLAHPPCKAARPKRSSKLNKRSHRTRAERRRTCTGSSDEAELSPNAETAEMPATLQSNVDAPAPPAICSVKLPSAIVTIAVPSTKPDATKLASSPTNAFQAFPSSCLIGGPPSTGTLHPSSEKPNGSSRHGRAKSVASILDVVKPPVLSLRTTTKDDWDMPPSSDGSALTWQQRKKSKPKAALANDIEPRVMTPPTSSITKAPILTEPVSGNSPLLRSTSLRARPTTSLSARRARAALARTPSAGNAQAESTMFPTSTMVLFGSKCATGALDAVTSFSVPPSPTPDRQSFGQIMPPTPVREPTISPKPSPVSIGDDSSLTWQQAIMRSSPPKNTLAATPLPVLVSHSDKSHITLASDFPSSKQTSSNSPAFITPVKSATFSSRRSGPNASVNRTTTDDHNRSAKSKPSKRRNSMSSTYLVTKSPEISHPAALVASPLSVEHCELIHLASHDRREERAESLPTSGTTPAASSISTPINSRHANISNHRFSTPLPLTPSLAKKKSEGFLTKVAGTGSSSTTFMSNHTPLRTSLIISRPAVSPLVHSASEPTPQPTSTSDFSLGAISSLPSSAQSSTEPSKFSRQHVYSQPASAGVTKTCGANSLLPSVKPHSNSTMYAGPQFHNSPSPAALPAPKFSFAS